MKKILLIDGFGFIFKSYYTFINRPLTNSNGENTSAIFGFFKSLISVLKKENPDYYLIALEGQGECFRNKIYPEYKANRPLPPEDLKYQIITIIELIKKLDLPHLAVDGHEADDVIGTLSSKFVVKNENRAVIFSIDKDMRQLVNNHVSIDYTDKSTSEIKTLDEDGVYKVMGIKPSQVVDYLALKGDSSDNIPGVKGVGEKTAVQLLTDWENLENIYNNIDKLQKESLKSKLLENKENAFLSKELATIKKDIQLDIVLDDIAPKPIQLENAIDILKKNNLNSIIEDIKDYNLNYFGKGIISAESIKEKKSDKDQYSLNKKGKHYKIVYELDNLKSILNKIEAHGSFCFDLETTGFDFLNDKIICISIAFENDVFVIPINISFLQQKEADISIDEEQIKKIFNELKRIFENNNILKIGHNIKFDIKFLKNYGFNIDYNIFDTMIAEYCIDASHNILNMDDLAEKYLNYKTIHYKDIVKNTKKETLMDVPLDELINYSGQDADITFRLYQHLNQKLEDNQKAKKLFYDIEIPLLKVLIDMEYYGVSIDKDYLNNLSKQLESEIDDIHKRILDIAGEDFNPNSTKQLAEILFYKLKLPVIKKTKTGPSTDVDVLNKLSYVHPIAGLLLDYRTLSKIKSTYSDALPLMINLISNKIHTTYMQTGTQTGRLSSKNPNLQNIPVKTDIGNKIRKAFVPTGDNILISADYSQIELFLLAELSKDKNLYDAFKNGEDIHIRTAMLIFDKKAEDVTKEERNIGKTINFSILYGQGAFRLSENLGISRKEAANFINIYFAKYSGISEYMESIREKCRKLGYAETLWGRKRTIPEINDQNKMVRANGERIAVNTTIQGTAADLMKISMIKIYKKFKEEKLKSKIIMQVHDELIFDVVLEEKDKVIKIVKESMEKGFDFNLQLRTSIKIGDNWGELQ